MENYKILEDRPELTKEQVLAGMSFGFIQKNIPVSKNIAVNVMVAVTIVSVVIISSIFIYNSRSAKSNPKENKPIIIDTLKESENPSVNSDTIAKELLVQPLKQIKNVDTIQTDLKTPDEYKKEEVGETDDYVSTKSLSFQKLTHADSEYAIEIKDSVYGPTNVSRGYGDFFEYIDKTNPRCIEVNSAWFKFMIKRDTLLTFNIVPKLGTDDYDFALFKCSNENCIGALRSNKIKPVRVCFGWNSSENCNTGLSNSAKDTTYEGFFANGIGQGRTYAKALRVKAGELYYLMITNNLRVQKQDPEGFMIYFYNTMPKRKANRYK